MKIKAVYDNEGKTIDRYTIYFNDSYINRKSIKMYNCLCSSDTGAGFFQHSSGQLGRHNGRKIIFEQLPKEVQERTLALYPGLKEAVKTIDKIVYKVSCKYGAPMGRADKGTIADTEGKRIFDCMVPMADPYYDKGGAYWGSGAMLRACYTKDLSFIRFYRADDRPGIVHYLLKRKKGRK